MNLAPAKILVADDNEAALSLATKLLKGWGFEVASVPDLVHDEHLPPGTGYPDHPHRDVEIVTLVVEGALRHTDSAGHTGVLRPGAA